MGGAIAFAVFVSNTIKFGFAESLKSFPALICLAIGATLAGYFYDKIEKRGC